MRLHTLVCRSMKRCLKFYAIARRETESDADDTNDVNAIVTHQNKLPASDIIDGSTPILQAFTATLFVAEPNGTKNGGPVPTRCAGPVENTPEIELATVKGKKNSLSGKLIKKTGKLVRIFRKK